MHKRSGAVHIDIFVCWPFGIMTMPPSPTASISVRDLAKRYGSVKAVRGVSFEVAPGEIYGLLGPNGAGKTTTIECLLGLRRPDAGSINLGGIDALSQPSQARQLVGAQLQSASLQDKITPRQACRLFASFYREAAQVDELLAQFSLLAKADASFDSLSGGQRQRLFLALAFVNRPRLVVLDEPTAGLDPLSRRELHHLITSQKSAGIAVLLSTHYLEEAHLLCDRIGILHEGRIIASGTPGELIARSRAHPRLTFKTAQPLDAAQVAALPAVVNHQFQTNGWMLATREVNRTIRGLVQALEAGSNEMLDLQIHQPSLEDVFLELTGKV
jgi:ABC-2 type transport system ATP-binding protein